MSDRNSRPSVFTRDALSRTASRVYPFRGLKVAATSLAAADEIVTAPENEILLFQALNFSNGANASTFITFLSVPGGVAPGDEHIVIDQIEVPSNGYISLTAHFMIEPLERFLVFASNENTVRVSGWMTAHL